MAIDAPPAERLKEQRRALPDQPGVYLFRDARGRVIYVGKAKSIRKRVASHFSNPNVYGTTALTDEIDHIEYLVVVTEAEALLTEQNFIKQYKPRFNIRLRDDKSDPFLAVTMSDEWPRAMVRRGAKQKGTRYFGPYAHAYAIRETLDSLLRTFPVRTCSDNKFHVHERQGRPCLLFHIEK